MQILIHTIALEPARWTAQKASQPLATLVPLIAKTPFTGLEIFEPHLAAAPEAETAALLKEYGLSPVVLSSYLNFSPASMSAEAFSAASGELLRRLSFFGFKKVRLFPCPNLKPIPDNSAAIGEFAERIAHLASSAPEVEFLLETHDNSLADDPQCVVLVVAATGCKNVGLLWQPTRFEPAAALAQFEIQQPLVRHFHLQNRHPDGSFAPIAGGVVPWEKILPRLDADASIEFVPGGICPLEAFDLERTLDEVVASAEAARNLAG